MKPRKAILTAAVATAFCLTMAAPASADPPPWAPAWGHRAKHKGKHPKHPHHRTEPAVYAVPFGIDLGHCNREAIGAVLGGAVGAAAGSQIGSGSGKTAAVIGGTIIGVLVGGSIGRTMDRVDQSCVGQILEHAPSNQAVAWRNPDNVAFTLTPVKTWQASSGTYCREYQATAIVGGRVERTYGTACRQADGSWKIMN